MLLLLLIAVPVVEAFVFNQVGRALGWLLAVVLLLGTSVFGARLLRIQGRSAVERVSLAVSERAEAVQRRSLVAVVFRSYLVPTWSQARFLSSTSRCRRLPASRRMEERAGSRAGLSRLDERQESREPMTTVARSAPSLSSPAPLARRYAVLRLDRRSTVPKCIHITVRHPGDVR